VGQAVEQCGCHLRIAEHRRPFAKGKVCGDDDRSALVEPVDQMEDELTTGLRERQITEFIEDNEAEAGYWITWARTRPTFAERGPLIKILKTSTAGMNP
jgi:hypothetical protein